MTIWTSPPSSSADRVTEGLAWRPAPPGAAGAAPASGGPGPPAPGGAAGPGRATGAVGWPPVLVAEDLLVRGVVAAFSSRAGGFSAAPYDSLNLGLRVGDDLRTVLRNRRRLATVLSVAGLPWATLRQVHGATVVRARRELLGQGPPEARPPLAEADGLVTGEPGLVLAVSTADCVPVLLADPAAGVVAAVHAGWRGLAAGVLEAGVAAFAAAGADLGASVAVVGPAIGPCCYEVGPEVAEAVGERYPAAAATTLQGTPAIDTTAAAGQALERAGLGAVRAARECTAHQPERFFSHRRDGVTGRQAGVIALLERGPA
jgi:purine-nucleoside/S-methyl-5'-thioadenosine phosphorylase / adenosine deaminase